MTNMKNNRPIDKLRDSAGSFDLNTPDDASEISEMLSVDDRLLIVKEKGVYEIKLADQVDPERSNVNIPNTIQNIFPFGSQEPWVGKILLTAKILFDSNYLQSSIDSKEAMNRVLKLSEDIAALHELDKNFNDEQKDAVGKINLKIKKDRSVMLPTISNVEIRCNEFLQKSDHALAELFKIVRLFYPVIRSGGWDSLKSKIANGPKGLDNFHDFLTNALPLLHLIRNARNCVEHPRDEQKLVVTDFSIGQENNMMPPMVEILHPRTAIQKVPVANFFTNILQNLIEVIELMIVFLCARHVKPVANFPIQVVELPEDMRRSVHVRYGYGIVSGDKIIPMS